MTISIPSSFKLGGRTWTVKRGVKLRNQFGSCDSATCTIQIGTRCRDEEEELHAFFHELMHAITYTMGWEKFFKNEIKIDGVAGLLLQALTTAE